MPIRLKVKPKGPNDTSESTINVGSAKRLSGKIYVLSVFVAPHSNPWLPVDIERQKQKVFEAERWLKMQALRYGKVVEFVNSAFGSDGSFLDDEMPGYCDSSRAKFHYPSKVLLKMGFRSKNAFMDWARRQEGCLQCLAIVFTNTKGRCYASPISKELHAYDSDEFNLECCFIYRADANYEIETNAAVIAHELLHLFGAWDLYEDDNTHTRALKTSVMFPNSIMLTTSKDIWELQIDEINAWLVGLKEQGKDWYRWFEPDQNSYECE